MATTNLHQVLEAQRPLLVPGAYDAFSARCVQASGFPCVYLGGGNMTASHLGLPDIGLLSFAGLEDLIRRVRRAVDIPLLVDVDTGYGNVFAVGVHLRWLEDSGVAGVHLEDQSEQKRCGHAGGHDVIPTAEMCRKVEVAAAATSDDFVLIARTDARQAEGLDAAIARARAYVDAGADWIFVEALESREELEAVGAAGLEVPLLANLVVGGKTPLLHPDELAELGFDVVLYAGALLQSAGGAMLRTLQHLATEGHVPEDGLMTLRQRFEVLDHERFTAAENDALRPLEDADPPSTGRWQADAGRTGRRNRDV